MGPPASLDTVEDANPMVGSPTHETDRKHKPLWTPLLDLSRGNLAATL